MEKKEYHKMYYEKNKDKLKIRAEEKCACVKCGKEVRKDFLNKHMKTARCQRAQIPESEKIMSQILKMKESIKHLEEQLNPTQENN
jgi:hypothetical protein